MSVAVETLISSTILMRCLTCQWNSDPFCRDGKRTLVFSRVFWIWPTVHSDTMNVWYNKLFTQFRLKRKFWMSISRTFSSEKIEENTRNAVLSSNRGYRLSLSYNLNAGIVRYVRASVFVHSWWLLHVKLKLITQRGWLLSFQCVWKFESADNFVFDIPIIFINIYYLTVSVNSLSLSFTQLLSNGQRISLARSLPLTSLMLAVILADNMFWTMRVNKQLNKLLKRFSNRFIYNSRNLYSSKLWYSMRNSKFLFKPKSNSIRICRSFGHSVASIQDPTKMSKYSVSPSFLAPISNFVNSLE